MSRRLLLDANLAVLLFVGATSKRYTAIHKRLREYDDTDYDIAAGLIAQSDGVIFTPNVLTEASNLVRQIADPIKTEICLKFAEMVGRATEDYLDSKAVVGDRHHLRLGLSDTVLLMLSDGRATILTADVQLYLAASERGLEVINYNHVRDARPDYR